MPDGEDIVHRIEFVVFDSSPFQSYDTLLPEYWDLPFWFTDKLWHMADHLDNSLCSGCRTGVGYVLHEDDDNPARSGVRWVVTYLARQDGGTVKPLCEECGPYIPAEMAAV